MITVTWTAEEVRDQEYYKVGTWFLNEEEQGIVEVSCNSNFEPITSENDLIQFLETSLEWQI